MTENLETALKIIQPPVIIAILLVEAKAHTVQYFFFLPKSLNNLTTNRVNMNGLSHAQLCVTVQFSSHASYPMNHFNTISVFLQPYKVLCLQFWFH